MRKVHSTTIAKSQSASWWSDFTELVKLRLTLLVVMTSSLAYVVASGGMMSWSIFALLTIGGFLVAGAANALNEVLEKDYDSIMQRTQNRPLAAGRMSTSQGVFASGMMLLLGTVLLSSINPLTGLLGMVSVVSYAFVYTPLKRYTTLAVPVGAIPGAMPALIGCVAAQGELTMLALLLFAIQFLWQFPHFWAIAYLAFEDYDKAGYKFLPKSGDEIDGKLGWYSLMYTVLLCLIILPLHSFGLTNYFGFLCIGLVTIYYVYTAFNFNKSMERPTALKLMFASFIYLPVVFGVLAISAL